MIPIQGLVGFFICIIPTKGYNLSMISIVVHTYDIINENFTIKTIKLESTERD